MFLRVSYAITELKSILTSNVYCFIAANRSNHKSSQRRKSSGSQRRSLLIQILVPLVDAVYSDKSQRSAHSPARNSSRQSSYEVKVVPHNDDGGSVGAKVAIKEVQKAQQSLIVENSLDSMKVHPLPVSCALDATTIGASVSVSISQEEMYNDNAVVV